MKKISSFTLLAFTMMMPLFFSCGNKSVESNLQSRIDSLETALNQRDSDYRQLDEFFTVIADGLDSIAMQENVIFNPGKESPKPSSSKIKQDLATFKQTLANQRERISQLEKQLAANDNKSRKLQAIIVSVKAQVAEKEAQIAALQKELSGRDITIDELNKRMKNLSQQVSVQREYITMQNELLDEQDDLINKGYLKIATKKELKQAGLLTGGLLKKSKADFSNVDNSQFEAIDIRMMTEIEINSKKPKILTQAPTDSYTMEQSGKDKTILRISDPSRFWSVSKFLIIQTD